MLKSKKAQATGTNKLFEFLVFAAIFISIAVVAIRLIGIALSS